jgi:hypothetical protein
MAATSAPPELALRSHDATWNRARWDTLPADGNRYEVVDGYLYMSTGPSLFHQWIVGQAVTALRGQLDTPGIATTWFALVGVFMPDCDPVQPDIVVIRATDTHVYQQGRIVGIPALLVDMEAERPGYTEEWVRTRPANMRAFVQIMDYAKPPQ